MTQAFFHSSIAIVLNGRPVFGISSDHPVNSENAIRLLGARVTGLSQFIPALEALDDKVIARWEPHGEPGDPHGCLPES